MKILHLLGDAADLGGILSVIRCLHEITQSQGDRHVAFVQHDYRETRTPPLEYRYSQHLRAESSRHRQFLLAAIPSVFELRRLLRSEHFDLVHSHTRGALPVAALLAAVFRQTLVCTHHTYARRKRLYRTAARLAHFHTVVLTPNMARHYGFEPETPRLSQISACCAEKFFEPTLDARPSVRSPVQPVRLLGVGNIVHWKRWHLLIEAFSQLTPVERRALQFTHYGEAPSDPESMAYAASLQDRIRADQLETCVSFQGPCFDIPSRVLESDWFVLPSINEPCSVALIEALALGKPALVSASGGNVDIVSHGKTGLLFSPDNVQDLIGKLRDLLASQGSIAAPMEIRRSVQSRRAAQVARQYRELYQELIPKAPTAIRGATRVETPAP